MLGLNESIRSLYRLNMREGEGLGTAYEYYVKLRKLRRFIDSIGKPERILIAGLPERYGLSMDFFFLGNALRAEVVAVDERPEALNRAEKALEILKSDRLFDDLSATFLRVERLSELADFTSWKAPFDLALSCEVLQRQEGEGILFLSNLRRIANSLAVFAPNRDNKAHAKISGLRGLSLKDLVQSFQVYRYGHHIFETGYLDMPPFPPGISRSEEAREKAADSQFEALLMRGLQVYGYAEGVLPAVLKRKKAHIVYTLSSRVRHPRNVGAS